jgi:hypothetical protein
VPTGEHSKSSRTHTKAQLHPSITSPLDLETARPSATTGLLEFGALGLDVGFLYRVSATENHSV